MFCRHDGDVVVVLEICQLEPDTMLVCVSVIEVSLISETVEMLSLILSHTHQRYRSV